MIAGSHQERQAAANFEVSPNSQKAEPTAPIH